MIAELDQSLFPSLEEHAKSRDWGTGMFLPSDSALKRSEPEQRLFRTIRALSHVLGVSVDNVQTAAGAGDDNECLHALRRIVFAEHRRRVPRKEAVLRATAA